MIPRVEFDAYNRAVAAISRRASSSVEAGVLDWARAHPGASVAELRDAAKEVMDGAVQVYDASAASLAADWYDARAAGHGYKLPSAVTAVTYGPETVDAVARYQAHRLAAGDVAGFARACGEFAADDAMRSLNRTVLANAARDGGRGVRFARVPTGAETCPFCLLLASRGAVYGSRRTAGEFSHFHRGCDCKVVPGFEGDRDAEPVEGVRPDAIRDAISRMEDETGLSFADASASRALSLYMELHGEGWLGGGDPPGIDWSLNPRGSYGRMTAPGDYSEGAIADKGEEWRDLFALDALEAAGFRVATRPVQALGRDGRVIDGVTNPDLTIGGDLWEIKSPRGGPAAPKPGNELDYIGDLLRDAGRNFRNPYDPESKSAMADFDGTRRVVLNLRYRPAPATDEQLAERIRREMRSKRVAEVICIDPQGRLRYFPS